MLRYEASQQNIKTGGKWDASYLSMTETVLRHLTECKS